MNLRTITSLCAAAVITAAAAQSVQVGKASYTTEFPGTDEAGRNAVPLTTPFLSGKALGRPVPTNEWWSNEVARGHASALFNYPLTLCPTTTGLAMIDNLQFQAATADRPVTFGVEGVKSSTTTVCDYSDWTVTIRWQGDNAAMEATVGMGMPLVYFTKEGDAPVSINVKMGTVRIAGATAYVENSYNRGTYVIFAPEGSEWTFANGVLTSTLAGKSYWSAGLLPSGQTAGAGVDKLAAQMRPFAFAFPKDTRTEWTYDPATGSVVTDYIFTADVKEGTESRVLAGLLPHQWSNLDGQAPEFNGIVYKTVRGELRIAPVEKFTTRLKYYGVIPALPALTGMDAESGFSADEMKRLTAAVCDDNGFADWTDSYNDGQLLNRMLQTAEAAKAAGDEEGFKRAFDLVKNQLERWLVYTPGEKAFLFYYHEPWTTMLGYPAGHGQDNNINDHNFHWGYFIRAAAFVARYDRQWLADYGEMINLLVRDVASTDRNDPMFPYLRSFSPYAGHCWANGTASLSLGNDQESTSEAMQFNTALILWAEVTGNKELRDLGVYLYATELSAIREYWFDTQRRNFRSGYTSALASRVFGNAYDNENFWGGGIAGSYGIQIYPVHAGSFYLSQDRDYHARLWNAMASETEILNDDANPNIWYDTWLRYLSMTDPAKALDIYGRCTHLGEKFGESQAFTYYWLHAMSTLGSQKEGVTADSPTAMAFERDGASTYVAYNESDAQTTVTFSDGFKLAVEPHSMATASDGTARPSATLSVEPAAEEGVETLLIADVQDRGQEIAAVEFFCDGTLLGRVEKAPWTLAWTPSAPGNVTLSTIVENKAGERFPGRELTVKVKKAGEPDVLSCTHKGIDASEGSFQQEYTVVFTTKGNSVEVRATFPGNYVGLVGPWLFNETNGFQEIQMKDAGNGWATTTINGVSDGDVIKVRLKIAYAGGLGVTAPIEYTVGSYCDDSTGVSVISGQGVAVWPNPASDVWNILTDEESSLSLWTLSGMNVGEARTHDCRAAIPAAGLQPGLYILRKQSASGSSIFRLIKK